MGAREEGRAGQCGPSRLYQEGRTTRVPLRKALFSTGGGDWLYQGAVCVE